MSPGPRVRESAVIELAAALGVSTTSGAHQVAVALELRYRLPRLWERVASGAAGLRKIFGSDSGPVVPQLKNYPYWG